VCVCEVCADCGALSPCVIVCACVCLFIGERLQAAQGGTGEGWAVYSSLARDRGRREGSGSQGKAKPHTERGDRVGLFFVCSLRLFALDCGFALLGGWPWPVR